MDQKIFLLANELGMFLKHRNLKIAVAESCTGGGICQAITEVPGSSQWFDRGFITYSNQAKIDMLGVKRETLEKHGAVSEQTALEMAEGALRNSCADISIAVTGIAGPSGATAEKPLGTVFVAKAVSGENSIVERQGFIGDRKTIRLSTVDKALRFVVER